MMYYVIQSIASKRYFNLENDEIKWKVSLYKVYRDSDTAEKDIRLYSLKNIEVITVFQETVDTTVTRVDRNLEFVNKLQERAKFFKLSSTGIKSLDKLVVNNYMYNPRIHTSTRNLYCRLPHKDGWNIICYEIASPGRVVITDYKGTKEEPHRDDKIAVIKVDYNNTVEKILVTELKNIDNKKHDRADTFAVDNPHVIRKNIDLELEHLIIPKNKPKLYRGHNQYTKCTTLPVNIDQYWYEISYYHVRKGIVHIKDYRKIDIIPEALQKIAFIERDNEQGIYKLSIGLWGARKKYKNIGGFDIETENRDYIVENPHEILG